MELQITEKTGSVFGWILVACLILTGCSGGYFQEDIYEFRKNHKGPETALIQLPQDEVYVESVVEHDYTKGPGGEPSRDAMAPKISVSPTTIVGATMHESPISSDPMTVASKPIQGRALAANKSMIRFHKVRPGETLMHIAFRYTGDTGSWTQIYQMNRTQLVSLKRVPVGLVLRVPYVPPTAQQKMRRPASEVARYKIQEGDTLAKIAQKLYGDSRFWPKLVEQNKVLIKNPHQIFSGFNLIYSKALSTKQ